MAQLVANFDEKVYLCFLDSNYCPTATNWCRKWWLCKQYIFRYIGLLHEVF